MDLDSLLKHLIRQKELLDKAITLLEEWLDTTEQPPAPKGRRGRKSMGTEERQEVSNRMKNYWAARRAKRLLKG